MVFPTNQYSEVKTLPIITIGTISKKNSPLVLGLLTRHVLGSLNSEFDLNSSKKSHLLLWLFRTLSTVPTVIYHLLCVENWKIVKSHNDESFLDNNNIDVNQSPFI